MDATVSHKMSDASHDFIAERDWVSFSEIVDHLRKLGFPVDGNCTIESPTRRNVFFWAGVSEELVAAIELLLLTRHVFIHPASLLIYWLDGCVLRWPVAKRPPANGYAKPHWLPVCLRITSSEK